VNRYKVPTHVLRAELSEDQVLLNPETGQYHLVNATGGVVLSALERGQSIDESVEDLARHSDQPIARLKDDVDAFIDTLLQRGLLEELEA
jgi:hypothetical protein